MCDTDLKAFLLFMGCPNVNHQYKQDGWSYLSSNSRRKWRRRAEAKSDD